MSPLITAGTTGLYVHIPLCGSKCHYCDFYSRPVHGVAGSETQRRIVDALIAEYDLRRKALNPCHGWRTIYVGGGTPSVLNREQLKRLIEHIAWDSNPLEFTIETNPDDVDSGWIELVKSLGVSRISMGVQSFHNSELRTIGRRHDASTACRAIELLQKSGLDYSLDLIFGLPGQILESWLANLSTLLSYSPPHFSAYLLSYELGTRLTAMREKGRVEEAADELVEAMYHALCRQAAKAGYRHYEISNFAKPGKEAIHNSSYWIGVDYLGIGPSAHSCIGGIRNYNPADNEKYIETIGRGELPLIIDEETRESKINDYLITSLRTSRGMSLSQMQSMFGNVDKEVVQAVTDEIAVGNLVAVDGRLRIPEQRWLLSDDILRRLILVS